MRAAARAEMIVVVTADSFDRSIGVASAGPDQQKQLGTAWMADEVDG
jgi:hypothetical protein